MFERKRPSACALALLLAGLAIASQAEAGCFGGLFCRDKRDKSYVRIANELYEATPSSELKDNLAAATDIHAKLDYVKDNHSYNELITRFGLLKDTDKVEQLCDEFRIRTLHLLAEAMLSQGNLEPEKMTEPIRRLNQIIIKQVLKARRTCFVHLAGQWPNTWKIAKEWPETYNNLGELDSLSRSKLLDSRPNFRDEELRPLFAVRHWACFLYTGQKESINVLRPYVNLLLASHIIEPASNELSKFYKDPNERLVVELALEIEEIDHPNQDLLNNVYRLRACEVLADREKTIKN